MADLRAVVSLYPEAFTVLARREAGIRTLSDLAGKRVNIGNPGSGSRATWDAVSEGLGVPTAALAAATELPPSSSFDELCEDGIDASVLVVGHPSPRVARAIRECDLVLVPADGPAIATLLQSQPHLVATTIPAATYGTAGDVPTFGGRATLVTRADVPAPVVEAVARAVMANIFTLRDMVPVMAMVRPAEMVTQSLTAPLHPGAVKAFQDLSLAP
jgi:TRAP transporter TAXI family solute receptor